MSGREVDFASGPYGTFKAAIIHYTQGLAYQLASKGIRADSMYPGNTYFEGGVWNMIKDNNPELYNTALALNPTGRMGTPQEMANGAMFSCEPGRQFHHGHEPCRGRRPDARCSVLGVALVAGCEEAISMNAGCRYVCG